MKTKYFWSRRDFLFRAGGGISGVALAHLLNEQGLLAAEPSAACQAKPIGSNPYAVRPPHFKPRAKAVISLFMSGGPSAVDLWDYKPGLTKWAGQPLDEKMVGDIHVRQGYPGPLMPSPFEFKPYGQSGKLVSEVFPHMGRHVDDLAFIHSVYGKTNDHVQAHYEMQTGQIRVGFPCAGSWVSYGLGCESTSLPAFVVINDPRGSPLAGPTNWSAGFMPAAYQGTPFRALGNPIMDLKPAAGMTAETQRARLDLLSQLNELDMEKYPGASDLAARISSYELAYRMQLEAADVFDVSGESQATLEMYGPGVQGRQMLIARRLVERGVRFVQCYHGDVQPWETCMTLNRHWGYKKGDEDWKPTATLVRYSACKLPCPPSALAAKMG